MKKLRFAVLGAGAGGQTMAAFLAEKGYPVRLYDHNLTRIQQLQALKTIRATGKWTCQGTVAVARALMNEPDVVFADEPSGSLDSHNKAELHQLDRKSVV